MPTFNKPKAENKPIVIRKKHYWKLWLIAGIFMMALIAMAGYGVKSFFDKYYIVSPIQSRIVSPLPEPIATTSAVMKPQKQAYKVYVTEPAYAATTQTATEITDKIFTLESSRGRNDSCRDQGKFNGYGFAQSTFTWNCFDTQEEVVSKVVSWVQDKLDNGFTTAELLCYYNQGIKEDDCPYYQNFLSL